MAGWRRGALKSAPHKLACKKAMKIMKIGTQKQCASTCGMAREESVKRKGGGIITHLVLCRGTRPHAALNLSSSYNKKKL